MLKIIQLACLAACAHRCACLCPGVCVCARVRWAGWGGMRREGCLQLHPCNRASLSRRGLEEQR